MKESLIDIVKVAGEEILKVSDDKSFSTKGDYSPLTAADKVSHDYLKAALVTLYDVPVLSEEECVPFESRSQWKEFWLIDPLDGTKEFINGYDDYCINVALIQDNQPVIGIIYAPKLDEIYYAQKGCGFEYRGAPHQRSEQGVTVAISRFHHSDATKKFMQVNQLTYTSTIGAALKFGRMALGLIDIYPRFEGSKEWDTAAGQIILEESGGSLVDLKTRKKPLYNKKSVKNNYFIALRNELDHTKFQCGDLV